MKRGEAEEYLPDERSEITRKINNHEVFLSFNSDEHAYAFHDWWGVEGGERFIEWLTEYREGETR